VRLRFTERATKDYAGIPVAIRKALEKQLRFLLANLGHPSLHAKKYGGIPDVWQGRVTRDWRFYFKIEGDEYVILSITAHPK
jgi:mRNA-degrading endonuclease RelE of RelBE toxin-antitoxin system